LFFTIIFKSDIGADYDLASEGEIEHLIKFKEYMVQELPETISSMLKRRSVLDLDESSSDQRSVLIAQIVSAEAQKVCMNYSKTRYYASNKDASDPTSAEDSTYGSADSHMRGSISDLFTTNFQAFSTQNGGTPAIPANEGFRPAAANHSPEAVRSWLKSVNQECENPNSGSGFADSEYQSRPTVPGLSNLKNNTLFDSLIDFPVNVAAEPRNQFVNVLGTDGFFGISDR
jgi:hypothetical protein